MNQQSEKSALASGENLYFKEFEQDGEYGKIQEETQKIVAEQEAAKKAEEERQAAIDAEKQAEEEAEREAKARGALSITLNVFSRNQRALKLYERLGFDAEIQRCIKIL